MNMKRIIVIIAMAMLTVSAFAQQKFAHVNFSELVQLCPEADDARATMAASQKEVQATFNELVGEYNTKYEQYQSKASTWPAQQRPIALALPDLQL